MSSYSFTKSDRRRTIVTLRKYLHEHTETTHIVRVTQRLRRAASSSYHLINTVLSLYILLGCYTSSIHKVDDKYYLSFPKLDLTETLILKIETALHINERMMVTVSASLIPVLITEI